MALSDVGTNLTVSLLAQTGSDRVYSRGATTDTIRFYRSDQDPPVVIDNGNGSLIEINMVSFRGLDTAVAAKFGNPQRGDKITDGTKIYEVQPVNDKVSYTVGGMLHIHTKQVN